MMTTFSLILCALVLYLKEGAVCVRFGNFVFWECVHMTTWVSMLSYGDIGAGHVIVWDV